MPYVTEEGLEVEEDWVRGKVLDIRGGCACSWPNARPPCWRCVTEETAEELAEIGVEWRDEPPPIDYLKATRDLCK